jgi:type I restriction enzyme S subunit
MEKLQPKLRFPEFEGNWIENKLDDICFMQAGKFIQASKISEKLERNFFPCYGGNGLRGFTNSFNYEGKYSLIGRQGALCGNVTLVKNKFYATEHAIVVNLKANFDSDYTYYLLGLLNLNQYATGQAQPGLSVQNLKEIKVIVSNSLPEQQKIASFLTTVDDKISNLKQKVSLLEKYKKGVMQQIFSQQIRFKDENGNDYPEWEEKSLGEVSNKISSNISANKIEENFGDYIIYGASGILKKVDFYLEKDDYISIVKDGAGIGRIFYCKGQSSVLGTLDIIRPNKNLNCYFLYYLLNNIDFTKYATGSTIPHIYYKDYSKEICLIPSYKEQTKIAEFLSGIDDKIETNKLQLSKMEVWKKGLLQGMFC